MAAPRYGPPQYPECLAPGFDFVDMANHEMFGIEQPSGCGLFSNSSCVPEVYGQPSASWQCCTQTGRDTTNSAGTYDFAVTL